jgi:hypothetical protein
MTRSLTNLKSMAARLKPGFLARCLAAGALDHGAGAVHFADATWQGILREFDLPSVKPVPPAEPKSRPLIGLGDLVHKVAAPIGRIVNWPCLKKDGTTDLIPGSPCANARDLLNKVKI